VAAEAVNAAAERDTGSGNGIHITEVTDEGVEIEAYEFDDLL
jgi:proteasome beta subunit